MAEISIGAGFTKSFGSSAAYVLIQGGNIILESRGEVYLDVEASAAADKVVINGTSSGSTAVQLRGDIQEVRVLEASGTVAIESTTSSSTSSGYTEVDKLYVSNGSAGRVTIETAVAPLAALHIDSGRTTCSAPVNKANIYGGTLTQDSTGTISVLNAYGPSIANLDGSGTVTTLNVYGSTVRFRNNASDGLTVTTCNLYTGTIDLSASMRNVTFTNDIINKGGTLIPPLASTVSLAY
tara:strand:+ start:4189 stop:4902 length:714 start_codon:yes stop_codon:yes gene_type:complete